MGWVGVNDLINSFVVGCKIFCKVVRKKRKKEMKIDSAKSVREFQ